MTQKSTRRNFIVTSVAVAGGIVGGAALQQNLTSASKNQPPITTTMPERELRNTGVRVPIFGLGSAGQTPLSRSSDAETALAEIENRTFASWQDHTFFRAWT